MTHICVSRPTITGSENGLSPGRRQAIIWTNVGILLIGRWGTNFSENLIEILTFSFTKMRLKVSSVKWWPFCLRVNVLITPLQTHVCMWPAALKEWSATWLTPNKRSIITIDLIDPWTIKSKLCFNMSQSIYSLSGKTSYCQILKLLDLLS